MSKKSWPISYVGHYIKWVKTSWTYSIRCNKADDFVLAYVIKVVYSEVTKAFDLNMKLKLERVKMFFFILMRKKS